ncbi:ribonuclease Y [Cellulomonas wangsupingiae]|uniref:ribonuclease Y n=1 Tax=Cellulomonas wangsupingiae TaxID=2968085 RepID=UPI001D0ECFF5|nr:ribonuclease Y [Cellulomonas wangsupingiae]MCM0639139.1 ribonuclease Y [Cellulomonas wangsupingiae]
MEPAAFATVVGLLGACLVALILVLTARREADQHRRRASEDVARIRDEARAMLADAERRERRVADRERELAAERAATADLERRARAEAEALAEARRVAARELDKAERVAARTVADADRAANERLADARAQARAELESVSGITQDEALAELTRRIGDEAAAAAAAQVRRVEAQARRTAEARARRIVSTAVQRVAVPTSAQAAVTILPLPSDEMKGRIIGKEGRNIRHFEALTGVNVLVDETPDTVVLSCFDAERRELAEVTLETLMSDGRIHPQRIEAAYAEAVAGADDRHDAAGHDAAERAGVDRLHPDLVRTMGRLRLRSSYGQNVLEHLVESAQIAAAIASEVGADVAVARRGAFLHDLGKALTGQVAGPHAAVGADLARRAGESDAVVNAIAAHHDEVPAETVEAVLVQAADAVSASRPGARRQEIDQYVERMGELEALVTGFRGVRRALAMAAGREVRVVVEPDEVDDHALPQLASAIAKHIEADLTYPGEIRVTVVRELRASATAG